MKEVLKDQDSREGLIAAICAGTVRLMASNVSMGPVPRSPCMNHVRTHVKVIFLTSLTSLCIRKSQGFEFVQEDIILDCVKRLLKVY